MVRFLAAVSEAGSCYWNIFPRPPSRTRHLSALLVPFEPDGHPFSPGPSLERHSAPVYAA